MSDGSNNLARPRGVEGFYWQTARDSLLTPLAPQLFQIASRHDGEEFDAAKVAIDAEYETVTGSASNRHGGKFQTAVQVYQEAGWIDLTDDRLVVTDVGKQALELLISLPDFLKAVPYFLVELLSRYQLNNPAKPPIRNDETAELRASSNIFPYWTVWKIMRSCGNEITIDELRRFVFRLHRTEDIEQCIQDIVEYRADREAGFDEAQLDAKYPPKIEGANGEPKYVMGRAGRHIGGLQPLIYKTDSRTYRLSEDYLPFIDEIVQNEPTFRDDLNEETWIAEYGSPVGLETEYVPAPSPSDCESPESAIDETHLLVGQIETLLEEGARSFLLVGPPGTSKSWYARQLAYRLTQRDSSRIRLVQFHPSYGYEDFIEGFVPMVSETGGLPVFVREWKIFAEACNQARDGHRSVLIIDEFSRGDTGRIFGEALTYLEPDYRDTPFTLTSGRTFSIPKDLVIIATMNPYDRSVSAVDVAMQRRFEVIRMHPSSVILRGILDRNRMSPELVEKVLEVFQVCQEVMPQGGLGHAYFLRAKDVESLERIWAFKLEPLFEQELRFEPEALSRIREAYRLLKEGP